VLKVSENQKTNKLDGILIKWRTCGQMA